MPQLEQQEVFLTSFSIYLRVGCCSDSVCPDLHAFSNMWKGRVLADGAAIVFDLFLAVRVIYFMNNMLDICECLGAFM